MPPEEISIPNSLAHKDVDSFEKAMLQYPRVELPLTHTFVPNMYVRKIFMPKGSLVTSKIHKVEHPFFILQGSASVFNVATGEVEFLKAPHLGVTVPGTRRVIYNHEDSVWATCHSTILTDVEEIEAEITIPYENPLVQGSDELKHYLESVPLPALPNE